MREKMRLYVPADLKSEAVLEQDRAPVMSGKGTLDLVCGNCATILVRGAGVEFRTKMVGPKGRPPLIRCPKCKALNQA